MAITFASVTALNRAFAVELDHGALDGLLLAPVGREAIYLGKLVGNLLFTGLVQAITIPLFVLFFNLDLHGTLPAILLLAFLATVGFTAVGTVFSALTARVQFNELMLPVLLLPFMVPPLIGAAQVTSKLLAGRPLADSAGSTALIRWASRARACSRSSSSATATLTRMSPGRWRTWRTRPGMGAVSTAVPSVRVA